MRQIRSALARRHVKFIAPLEARFASDYRALARSLKEAVVVEPGRLTDGLRSEWKARAVEAMRPAYRAAIKAGGRDFLLSTLSLRKGGTFDLVLKKARKSADIVTSLEDAFADRLAETVDTTFDALESILDEAADDNLDDDEIADLVEEEWSDLLGERTDAIATTETNGAVNAVRDYLMREVVELQAWITAGDERVRPTHLIYGEAGPKPVGFDWSQLADSAGYTLRFPCDPECHEPSEVINCRCFTAPAGEVDLSPEELKDYLDDFEMDPEDVMLSEDQEPVYVTNQHLGKEPRIEIVVKGDFEGHPFRGNQWTSGYAHAAGDENRDEDAKAAYEADLTEAQAELEKWTERERKAKEQRNAASDAVHALSEEAGKVAQEGRDAYLARLKADPGVRQDDQFGLERLADEHFRSLYDSYVAERGMDELRTAQLDAQQTLSNAEKARFDANVAVETLKFQGPEKHAADLTAAKEERERGEAAVKAIGAKVAENDAKLEARRQEIIAKIEPQIQEALAVVATSPAGPKTLLPAQEKILRDSVLQTHLNQDADYQALQRQGEILNTAQDSAARQLAAAQERVAEVEARSPYGSAPVIDPERIGSIEARREVLKDSIERVRADVPSPEKFAALKAEEEAGFVDSPAVKAARDERERFAGIRDAAQARLNDANDAISTARDAAYQQGAKDLVEAAFRLRPDLDFREKSGEEAAQARIDADAKVKAADEAVVKATESIQEERRLAGVSGAQALVDRIYAERPEAFEGIAGGVKPQFTRLSEAQGAEMTSVVARYIALTQGASMDQAASYQGAAEELIDNAIVEREGIVSRDPIGEARQAAARAREEASTVSAMIEASVLARKGSFENAMGFVNSTPLARQPVNPDNPSGLLVRDLADVPLHALEKTPEYAALQQEKKDADAALFAASVEVSGASDALKEAQDEAKGEFALRAGPGYYFQKFMQDEAAYNETMDELRGGWQHIGGEGPSRLRAAVGIGLGLQEGAIYDSKKRGFIDPSEYDNLRDDERTIRYAGALRREYLETQEDIANGRLGHVESLGQDHMGGKAGSGEDPEETWSDDQKYNLDQAKQDWYESNEYSDAEYAAQSEAWDSESDAYKLRDYAADGNNDLVDELRMAAARAQAANEEGSPWSSLSEVNDADPEEQAKYLREKLGDKYEDIHPSEATVREEALREIQSEKARDAERSAMPLAFIDRAEKLLQARGLELSGDTRAAIITAFGQPNEWARNADATRAVLTQIGGGKAGSATQNDREDVVHAYESARVAAIAERNAVAALPLEDGNFTSVLDDDRIERVSGELAQLALASNWERLWGETADDDGEAWATLKDETVEDIFPHETPNHFKYHKGSSLEEAARSRFGDDWQWDDQESAWDDWWSAHQSEYETEDYQAAKADYEENQNSDSEPATEPPDPDSDPRERGTIRVYRGIKSAVKSYVHSFTDSWSTSKDKAREFGATKIMEWDLPLERILVFQGARNWAAQKVGGYGNTEYEVMPLSDMPKWYRESYRAYMKAKKKGERNAS